MSELKIYSIDASEPAELPYADDGVRAGFPSPAQDFMSEAIDLNRDLVTHPESTFYARVEGDSMTGAGVFEGDILVVDKLIDKKSTGEKYDEKTEMQGVAQTNLRIMANQLANDLARKADVVDNRYKF